MSKTFPKQVEAFSYNLFDELLSGFLHNLDKIPISTAYRFHGPLIDYGDEPVPRQLLNAVVFRVNYFIPFLSDVLDRYEDYQESLTDFYKTFKDTIYTSEIIKFSTCDLVIASAAVLFHMNTGLVNTGFTNFNCYLHMLWYRFYDAELRIRIDREGGFLKMLFDITYEYKELGRIHQVMKDAEYLPFMWFDFVSTTVDEYKIFQDKWIENGKKSSRVLQWVKHRLVDDNPILSSDFDSLRLSECRSFGEMFIVTAKVYLDPSKYQPVDFELDQNTLLRFQTDSELESASTCDPLPNGQNNEHGKGSDDICRNVTHPEVKKTIQKVNHVLSEDLCSYLKLVQLYGNKKLVVFGRCKCCDAYVCSEIRTENFVGKNFVRCVKINDVDEDYLENGLITNFTQNGMDSLSDKDDSDSKIFNTIFLSLQEKRLEIMYLNFKRSIVGKCLKTPISLTDLRLHSITLFDISTNGTTTTLKQSNENLQAEQFQEAEASSSSNTPGHSIRPQSVNGHSGTKTNGDLNGATSNKMKLQSTSENSLTQNNDDDPTNSKSDDSNPDTEIIPVANSNGVASLSDIDSSIISAGGIETGANKHLDNLASADSNLSKTASTKENDCSSEKQNKPFNETLVLRLIHVLGMRRS